MNLNTKTSAQTVKTSISIEPDLLERAKVVASLSGYKFSFSAYISELLKKDVQCRIPELTRHQSA